MHSGNAHTFYHNNCICLQYHTSCYEPTTLYDNKHDMITSETVTFFSNSGDHLEFCLPQKTKKLKNIFLLLNVKNYFGLHSLDRYLLTTVSLCRLMRH